MGRGWRAVAVIAAAAVAVTTAGLVYLHPRLGRPGPAAPPPTQGARLDLDRASFGDADHGAATIVERGPERPGPPRTYASAWLTSNGGRTWRRVASSQTAQLAAAFLGPRRILLWTDVAARVSDDDGRTWHSIALPTPASQLIDIPVFIDPLHGWVVVTDRAGPAIVLTPSAPAAVAPAPLWRTSNGGLTWQQAVSAGIPAGVETRPAFLDARRGAVAVTRDDGTVVVLVTGDGGDSWQVARTLVAGVGGAVEPGAWVLAGGGRLFAIVQWSTSATVTTGDAASRFGGGITWNWLVTISGDGGETWGPPGPAPSVTSAALYGEALAADDRGRLYLAGGGTVWTSSDGAVWRRRTTAIPSTSAPAGQLTAVPGALFLTLTAGQPPRATVLRSRDGGAHWSAVPLPG